MCSTIVMQSLRINSVMAAFLSLLLLLTTRVPVMAADVADKTSLADRNMEVGIVAGSTGVGLDLSLPLASMARLRAGFSYVPRVEVPMTFGIQVGDDPSTSEYKFNRMSSMLESLTGNKVVSHVDMIGEPTMWNVSVLADIYPLKKNRNWRVTAGLYIGPKTTAQTFNKTESMPSLMGVDIYNNMYNKLHGVSRKDLPAVKLIDLGEGYEMVYTDPETLLFLQERFDAYGRMGIPLGTYSHDITDAEGNVLHQKGDPYVMEPNNEHMVKARMLTSIIKPYVGIGYDGRLTRRNERLGIGFDLGVMTWGGTPKLIIHDGTDLISDVEGIGGKVGSYVRFMSHLKAYPVATVRLTYTIY